MNRILTVCVFVAFMYSTFGCHSAHQFLAEERRQIKEPQRIYKVQTTDGRVISFESDSLGYAVMNDTTIQRFLGNDSTEVISLSAVKILYTKGPDPKRTGIAILLGAGVTALVIASMAHAWGTSSWH